MDGSTLPLRTKFAGVVLAWLILPLAACGGASSDPVAELAKVTQLEPGQVLVVFVYTDG